MATTMTRALGLASTTAAAVALAMVPFTSSAVAAESSQPIPAVATASDSVDQALSEFRSGLASRADADPDAARGLTDFDDLSPDQRQTLGEYLTGRLSVNLVEHDGGAPDDGTASASDGEFEWVSEPLAPATPGPRARATTYNVHATGDASFSFAGILISKTRVWADYVTGSGVVKSISNYGCQVLKNFDVFSTITTAKAGQSLSGGRATFLCNVVVKRGVPTPWGSISWSTASGLQYLSVNGPGVTQTGWR